MDAAGNLYVADTEDNRLRFVLLSGAFQSQSITFAPLNPVGYGNSALLTATASSNLPVTFISDTPALCTVSGSQLTVNSAFLSGDCTITASQAGNATYAAAPAVTQTFSIPKAAQTITFTPLTGFGSSIVLTATSSSGLPVTYTVSGTCSVNAGTLYISSAGVCTITADQAGNAAFAAAASVAQILTITQSPQTIYFGVPDATLPTSSVTLTGFSTSSLPLTYTSTTRSV